MKKLIAVFCLAFFLQTSVAMADQTIQTEHFEADLPGGWTRLDDNTLFGPHAILNFVEFPFTRLSGKTMDKNPNVITGIFGEVFIGDMPSYGGDLQKQPLTIDGKESALYSFSSKAGNHTEYAALIWDDGVLGYLLYVDFSSSTAQDDFQAIASTLRIKGHQAPTAQIQQQEAPSTAPTAPTVNASKKGESTIYDDQNIKAVISNLRIEYSEYLAADLTVYNNSDAKIFVILGDTYLNGWKVTNMGSAKISEGKSGKNMIIWYDSGSAAGIKKLSDLKQISFTVEIVNADTYETMYASDEITLQYE